MTTFSLLDTSLASTIVTDRRHRFERSARDHRRIAAAISAMRRRHPGNPHRHASNVVALPANAAAIRTTDRNSGSRPVDRVA